MRFKTQAWLALCVVVSCACAGSGGGTGGGSGGAAGGGMGGGAAGGTGGTGGGGTAGGSGGGTGGGTAGGTGGGTAGGTGGGSGGGAPMGGTVFVASTFPKRMTLANGSLYWVATMPMGYALKTAPVGNGPNPTVTTLYADTTRNCVEKGISADATGVYWTSLCEPMMLTNQYAVRKCALPAGCGTGPTAATTLASNLTRAQGNTVANGFVYWTEQSSAAPVKRIGTNGNGGSTLFQNPTDPKFVNPVSIVTDGTDVAWTTSGNPIAVGYVAVCPVSGCPAEASMVKFGTPVSGLIALAPGKVVYTEGGKIRTANRDGTGAADLVTADASALTADATHVYWQERALGGADQVGKRIFKCALAGCAGTGTVLASDAIPLLGPTGDLLVDATHVFYMANPYEPAISGAIMRVAK